MSENYGLKTDACYNSIAQLNCAIERKIVLYRGKKSLKHSTPSKGRQFIILSPFLSLSGNYSLTYCNQVQYDTACSTVRFSTSSIYLLGLFKTCKSSDYPDNL